MKETTLERFDFYQSAAAEERLVVRGAAVEVHLPHGALFYREGEDLRQVALVGRGDIRVFKTTSNGRELTLYHVRDGQPCLVNLLSVVLGRRAMASAVAVQTGCGRC